MGTHEVISTSMRIMKSLFATFSLLFLANLNHTLAAKNVIMPKGQDLKIFSGNGVYQFKEKDNYAEVAEIISEELNIFCYNGTALSVLNFWSAAEMKLKIDSDEYHIYMGKNVSMVIKQHDDAQSQWFYQVLPWK